MPFIGIAIICLIEDADLWPTLDCLFVYVCVCVRESMIEYQRRSSAKQLDNNLSFLAKVEEEIVIYG